MFRLKRVLLSLVTVLILHISCATYIHARRHCALGYTALRPFLRKPTVTKRTSREEKKRRSEFHKQLHKELRMKYWERLDPAVNNIIQYKPERQVRIDPKRAFVVQEAIPQLVKLEQQQANCFLTAEQSEAFDRRAGLKLLCDIKAVFSFIAETINTDDQFKDFKLMASQEQLPKQQADVNYIMSLLKVRKANSVGQSSFILQVETEPEPSTECTEYLGHLAELAGLHPIRLALDEEKLPRAPAGSPETCCEDEERFV
ncbi:signal peptide containing protein, putative [Babesia ovata]|uniref:Signal peptide containing protein, putative n=1 Tax=Babesia ovata TaxID=189622 RepID=A0A2H6KC10_9APIC|nr:signal peptide containing protein, putative [Babesia ovata]GBE60499.1 signal peptide containing protein, putative [Babesia ovata]